MYQLIAPELEVNLRTSRRPKETVGAALLRVGCQMVWESIPYLMILLFYMRLMR